MYVLTFFVVWREGNRTFGFMITGGSIVAVGCFLTPTEDDTFREFRLPTPMSVKPESRYFKARVMTRKSSPERGFIGNNHLSPNLTDLTSSLLDINEQNDETYCNDDEHEYDMSMKSKLYPYVPQGEDFDTLLLCALCCVC